MKVLYIGDRRAGGIASHVKCLTDCLSEDVGRYVIGIGGNEPFAGRNGHDIREFFQIRRVMRKFKPDVVHFHIPNLLMALYVRIVRLFELFDCLVVCSWHTPANRPPSMGQRLFFWLLDEDCYFLPVSTPTWDGLKTWLPRARGEVFFNSIRISGCTPQTRRRANVQTLVVGMVGRNADQKDWPGFHEVEDLVKSKIQGSRFKVSFLNAGEKESCDGRAAIAKMDLFVMTSKHEQLPMTMLECFALGTPICGFVPVGGVREVLGFSAGPVREAFIEGRDCGKLADLVVELLLDEDRRRRIAEDGRRIVEERFNAEKNCRSRLMEVYRGLRDVTFRDGVW